MARIDFNWDAVLARITRCKKWCIHLGFGVRAKVKEVLNNMKRLMTYFGNIFEIISIGLVRVLGE